MFPVLSGLDMYPWFWSAGSSAERNLCLQEIACNKLNLSRLDFVSVKY